MRQLSLAHSFDQREVQRVLEWRPRVSFDEGLAPLSDWFGDARR
jgi:nucleoside-diphosphate-sugar epimerase